MLALNTFGVVIIALVSQTHTTIESNDQGLLWWDPNTFDFTFVTHDGCSHLPLCLRFRLQSVSRFQIQYGTDCSKSGCPRLDCFEV